MLIAAGYPGGVSKTRGEIGMAQKQMRTQEAEMNHGAAPSRKTEKNHEAAPSRKAEMDQKVSLHRKAVTNEEPSLNPDQLAELAEKQAEEETVCCGSGRHKKRTPEEQRALLIRLKKIEGQIRGLEKMVENNAYCPDILIQSSAAASALNSFNKTLLGCHIRGCVAEDIRNGRDETIDELCNVLQKLMK